MVMERPSGWGRVRRWLILLASVSVTACVSPGTERPGEAVEGDRTPGRTGIPGSASTEVIAVDHGPRGPALIERPSGYVADLPASPEPLPPAAALGDRLDYMHDHAFLWTNRTLAATDRWFAEPDQEIEPVPLTPLVLGVRTTMFDRADGLDWAFKFDTDIDVRLPNTERRLRLVITSETVGEAPLEQAGEAADVRLGTRWAIARALDFDVGINAKIWPEVFASLKWSRSFRHGPWELFPFAKAFVTTDDGFGLSSGITLDHWTGPFLARSSSWAQWLKDEDFPKWTQYFVLARAEQLIAERRFGARLRGDDLAKGFGLLFGARRNLEEFSGASTWGVQVFYKWPLRGNWLFMYVSPGVQWEHQYGYHPDGVIKVGIDMLFWGVERR